MCLYIIHSDIYGCVYMLKLCKFSKYTSFGTWDRRGNENGYIYWDGRDRNSYMAQL